MGRFFVVWVGQLFSGLGSTVTAFGLNIWVYKASGSIASLSVGMLLALLPIVALSPFSGVVADRYNRRVILLAADICGMAVAMILAMLVYVGYLTIIAVYVSVFLQACAGALRWPAYQAFVSETVPSNKRRHAVGMMQMSEAVSQIAAPALGGALFAAVGAEGVIVGDIATYVIAIGASLMIGPMVSGSYGATRESFFSSLSLAWDVIKRDAMTASLLAFNAGINAVIGVATVLATPFILNFANSRELGVVMSIALSGMLFGGMASILMGKLDGQIKLIFWLSVIASLSIMMAPLVGNIYWFAGFGFIFFFSVSSINSANQLVWQKSLPIKMQGRIFSLKRTLVFIVLPFSYVAAPALSSVLKGVGGDLMSSDFNVFAGRLSGEQAGIAATLFLSGLFLLCASSALLVRGNVWQYRLSADLVE
ncbi:MFS transporter [Burkholderia cepacia]|uniref:MFS transporter n=1 Tax=Burkholderia cepacia TaxID=292 RepID=UPI002FE3FBC8